jgi:hypothetical protein
VSEWRVVPGFSRYKVSDEGQVRGRGGKSLKAHLARRYLVIKVWSDDGRRITKGVHQLVALAFLGPRPSQTHEVAHWDGTRTNNIVGNLRWATPMDNHLDQVRHGRFVLKPGASRGAKKGNTNGAILTREQVEDIRRRYTGAHGQCAELAIEFGISKSTLREVARGRKWKSVAVEATPSPVVRATRAQPRHSSPSKAVRKSGMRVLSSDQVQDIKRRYTGAAGQAAALAAEFGVGETTIRRAAKEWNE